MIIGTEDVDVVIDENKVFNDDKYGLEDSTDDINEGFLGDGECSLRSRDSEDAHFNLHANQQTLQHRSFSRNMSKQATVLKGQDALKLLTINEASWGGLLHQRIWRWPEDKPPRTMGKLVQSFFQFSREIGEEGEVACVNFEIPTALSQKRSFSNFNRSPWAKAGGQPAAAEAMQLVCHRDTQILVSCFYSVQNGTISHCTTREKVQNMIEKIHQSFSSEYSEQLQSMRPQFQALGEGHAQQEEIDAIQQDILDEFSGFSSIVDESVSTWLPLCPTQTEETS